MGFFPLNMFKSPSRVEEGRYSFGTTIVIDKMLEYIKKNKYPKGYLIYINVETLIRNRWDKNKKLQQLVDVVNEDMQGIMTELSENLYLMNKQVAQFIVFYTETYSRMIPQQYLKSRDSIEKAKIQDALAMFKKQFPTRSYFQNDCPMINVVLQHIEANTPSYKKLAEGHKSSGGQHRVLLMSHYPLDYFMFGGRELTGAIFKSFTGAVIENDRDKLSESVFKNRNIPFYPLSLILLGDKDLIKGTLKPKEKKAFIEMCELGGLNLRTRDYVMDKLSKNNFTLPYTL